LFLGIGLLRPGKKPPRGLATGGGVACQFFRLFWGGWGGGQPGFSGGARTGRGGGAGGGHAGGGAPCWGFGLVCLEGFSGGAFLLTKSKQRAETGGRGGNLAVFFGGGDV